MTATLAPASDAHINTGGAALIFGRTRHFVLSQVARGRLTPVIVGGKVFLRRDEVTALRDQLAAERERVRKPSRRVRR